MKDLRKIGNYNVIGKDFNVYGEMDNPMFIANEVYSWLGDNVRITGSANIPQMMKHVNDDDKTKAYCEGIHTTVKIWMITRKGLIDILMKSRSPMAKQFQNQLVSQYLNDLETDRLMTFTRE